MSFCQVSFFGDSIQKAVGMNVILPDRRGRFPVLYLLHGLSDDHTIWHRRTSIERYVAKLPLIVVMPDGARSFYCNDPRPGGLAYEDHIVRDVVGFVDRTFPTIRRRAARAVAGLSMGGYGATMLAMRHPNMFCAAASHSGALGFLHEDYGHRPELRDLIGHLPAGRYDCYRLARRLVCAGKRIAYRLDCGTEDFLTEHNRRFHAHLDRIGLKHEYAEYPGEHNWDYWDEHIHQTLDFVMKHVKTR